VLHLEQQGLYQRTCSLAGRIKATGRGYARGWINTLPAPYPTRCHPNCLRCWSLDLHVSLSKSILASTRLNTISKTIYGPSWVLFSLHSPPFVVWWQHNKSKQIIDTKLRTIYLLGCNVRARSYDAKGKDYNAYFNTLVCSYQMYVFPFMQHYGPKAPNSIIHFSLSITKTHSSHW
jgi:hypothetical protein